MGVGKPQREYVMVLIFRACTVMEIMRSAAVAFSIIYSEHFLLKAAAPNYMAMDSETGQYGLKS